MTIVCIEDRFPEIAYQFFGQLVRYEFAMESLGHDLGTEKAEESIFIDAYTNRTAGAADLLARDSASAEWFEESEGRGSLPAT